MKEGKIIIIGAGISSAGIGGVTIHIQRLTQYLEKVGFSGYAYVDYKSTSFFELLYKIYEYKWIHLHVSNAYGRLLLTVFAKIVGTRVITTFHGNYSNVKGVKKGLVNMALLLTDIPITINLNSYNYVKVYNQHSRMIPAFIPPQSDEPLDEHTKSVLHDLRNNYRILVSTNASNADSDSGGNEIYGISFLIDFFKDKQEYALIISDPSGCNKQKYQACPTNVRFISYPHSFYEILKESDISIRNTSTDGDSLSVKESLYLKRPTLCSDVVIRPYGCILFTYNNSESLSNALQRSREFLNENHSIPSGADMIRKTYEEVLA